MMKLLIATALTAVVFAAKTNAFSPHMNEYKTVETVQAPIKEAALTKPFADKLSTPTLKPGATIGIARLDKGRLIYAPMNELRDWANLDLRSSATFAPVSPAALIRNIPEVPMMGGRDSDNKLDEIRLTASDLRMDYVLIYGMGQDAQWGSFAGKALINTGFIINGDMVSPRASTKAMLVDTYTGKVYGTLTSDKVEFGVSELTDKVETLINTLTAKGSAKTV
ncbi:MAG: hypothetical protein JKY25_00685 [Robiginitomaculum sp.]|nr:hypothetical protein [Robiginitomaculum sp.]